MRPHTYHIAAADHLIFAAYHKNVIGVLKRAPITDKILKDKPQFILSVVSDFVPAPAAGAGAGQRRGERYYFGNTNVIVTCSSQVSLAALGRIAL